MTTAKSLQNFKGLVGGMKSLVSDLERISETLKNTLERRADVLANIEAAHEEDKVNTLVDVCAGLARAQIVTLDMGQKQLQMSLSQMDELLDGLEEDMNGD